ncbi:hypothetical protein HKD37_U058675 [Glycine soja]
MEGKETEGMLKMTTDKRQQKRSRSDREEERDRLSELPDCVVLHIMEFMDTKYAMEGPLEASNLSWIQYNPNNVVKFNKFVSRCSVWPRWFSFLLNLEFTLCCMAEPKLFNRLMKYAVLHNVQQFTVSLNLSFRQSFEFRPYIFSCESLTFLKLSFNSLTPRFLQLEAVSFTARDNDYAEPFSTCNVLNTLILDGCSLHKDAKFLSISNSSLSSLTISGSFEGGAYKIALSTPNLSSLTVTGHNNHTISSACNLSFLEEVTIDTLGYTLFPNTDLLIISWLQVLTNVKILRLYSGTLLTILRDISNPVSVSTQPPCFVQLKSLILANQPSADISFEQLKRAVEYLLQNSPQRRID